MRKFLRNWGGFTVAVVALLASASAVYFDNTHFEETLKREEQRNEKSSEEFQQQIAVQKDVDESQNIRHKQLLELQTQQYEELKEHHGKSLELQKELDEEQNRQLGELVETQKQHSEELKRQYEEVIKPHAKHEEIYDYISLLYDRLVLYRDWLIYLPHEDRKVAEAYYLEAAGSFHRAEMELRAGNFDESQRLIDDTYTSLSEGYAAIASSNTTAAE